MNFKIFSISLLASSALATIIPPWAIKLKPLMNMKAPNGFNLSKNVVTKFRQGNHDQSGHVALVDFNLTRPGVSTTDLGAIEHVECKGDQIKIGVPDSAHYHTALNWKTPFTLFVTQEWNCNGTHSNQLYLVNEVKGLNRNSNLHKRDVNNQLLLKVTPVDYRDHAEGFSFKVSFDNVTQPVKGESKHTTSENLSNEIWSNNTKIHPNDHQSLQKRFQYTKKETIDMNLNHDSKKGVDSDDSLLKGLKLFQTWQAPVVNVKCNDCWTKGSATIGLEISGRAFPYPVVDKAIFFMEGSEFAYLTDIGFDTSDQAKGLQINDTTIASVSPEPFGIPGIFQFTPRIDGKVKFSVSLDQEGYATVVAKVVYQKFLIEVDMLKDQVIRKDNLNPAIVSYAVTSENVAAGLSGIVEHSTIFTYYVNVLSGWALVEANIMMGAVYSGSLLDDKKKCNGTLASMDVSTFTSVGGGQAGKEHSFVEIARTNNTSVYYECLPMPLH